MIKNKLFFMCENRKDIFGILLSLSDNAPFSLICYRNVLIMRCDCVITVIKCYFNLIQVLFCII